MRRTAGCILAVVGGLIGVVVVLIACLTIAGAGHLSIRAPVAQLDAFDCAACSTYPGALVTDGDDLVRDDGTAVILRGVMVPELQHMADEGRLGPDVFRSIAAAGANVVRLPVDPEAWRTDPEYLARFLDPAVRWAGEAGLYAIIDLHMIGNIVTGTGQAMPASPAQPLAESFWRTTGAYFQATPHTLFEILNEPAGITVEAWRLVAERLVQTIRETGARQPVIVGGVDFASDASWVASAPLADANVAYAVHIYPGSRVDWQRSFGALAATYPVLVTEWGFMDENPSPTQAYLNGSPVTYGEPLMAFLAERDIGWVACWWDAEWEPPMLSPENDGLTGFGRFVKEQLGAGR